MDVPIVRDQQCGGAQGFSQSNACSLCTKPLLLECGIVPQLSTPRFQ